MPQLAVIIPSKTEKFLKPTVEDVLKKAETDIVIYAMLDGGEDIPEEEKVHDPRVIYHVYPKGEGNQKRHMINWAVADTNAKYWMTLDAHCMVGRGFDRILIENHQPNWVQVPRRLRLDAEHWEVELNERPPVDYEYPMWQDWQKGRLRSYRWESRTLERMHIPIDETMSFQGSCYFATKEYFNKLGLMQTEGYGGFFQENEEIVCKVWADGGKVMTNKKTWYAHLHKGKKYGRMYDLNWSEKTSLEYSYDNFVNKHRDIYVKNVQRFMPIPKWPENWQDYLPEVKNG